MGAIEIVLALLVGVVALSALARRIHIPYPIVLVLGGLALGAVPGLPAVRLDPDVVLLLFLPPLVYGAAWQTPARELRANLRPILLLAIGLVVFTTVAVADLAHRAIAPLDLLPAFLLGAIVSPTDTVAAEAIIARLPVPRRVVAVLGGESLFNDATGLVAYGFAVTAAETGRFSPSGAALAFVGATVGGVAIGLIVGVVAAWVLRRIADVPTAIVFSLLTPYAAYLPSQVLELRYGLPVSGVLATVAAGLYGGWREPVTFSSDARLQAYPVWNVATFVVNGLIFILVGLQLRAIVENLLDPRQYPGGHVPYTPAALVWYAALVALAVILVRVAWVFPAAYLSRLLLRRVGARDPYPGWRNVVVVAWTGMRGGVSLAAALALTARGDLTRPQVGLIVFLVFGAILGTLVVQGLTLPLLIARLGLADDGEAAAREEAMARLAAIQAVLARLAGDAPGDSASPEGIEYVRLYYAKRADHLAAHLDGQAPVGDGASPGEAADPVHDVRRLRREMIAVERAAVLGLRDRGAIGDETLRRIERGLDLDEARL